MLGELLGNGDMLQNSLIKLKVSGRQRNLCKMKTHLLLPFSGSVTALVRWSPGVASTSQEEVMGKYSGIFKPVWLLQISHDKSTDSRKLATDTFVASFFFSCNSG